MWGTQVRGRDLQCAVGDLFAEVTDAGGEDGGALGGFSEPEGQRGRGTVGVFNEDAAG
jgi:hypothetical protein